MCVTIMQYYYGLQNRIVEIRREITVSDLVHTKAGKYMKIRLRYNYDHICRYLFPG